MVGDEKDFAVGRNLLYDLYRVAAGADNVAEGLDRGGAVDVGHYVDIGILFLVGGQLVGGTGVGE